MKIDYMTRLTRAALWRLPRQEAEDIIADYQDMVGTPPRPDAELVRDLGSPVQAVKLLTQPRPYRLWLAVFALLSACVLLPAAALLTGTSVFRFLWQYGLSSNRLWQVSLPVGLIVSLVWFRRCGAKGPRLPRAILPVLLLLLAGMAAVWWLLWQFAIFPNGAITSDPQLQMIFFGLPSVRIGPVGYILHGALAWASAAAGVVGIVGLVKARTGDRRWLAAYILSLALVAMNVSVLTFLTSMSLDYFTFLDDWWVRFLPRYLAITAAGLIGTGVALC